MTKIVPNVATPEGREMGRLLARFYERELKGKTDNRCDTCAVRVGDHVACGSPETQMSLMKCLMERTPFWCHEHDRPCAGWTVLRFPDDETVAAPWSHPEGIDP